MYEALATDPNPGPTGNLTARGPAQMLRLSVVYALLDGSSQIKAAHVRAAAAVWAYSHLSVLRIFEEQYEDLDERLLTVIEEAGPEGISHTDQKQNFKNVYANDLASARQRLRSAGYIEEWKVPTRGRSRIVNRVKV